MRKYAYLARLEELLAPLSAQERQEALNYYEEYFDAAGNENEEKTAEELGDPTEVARKILEGEGIDPSSQEEGTSPAEEKAQETAEVSPQQEPAVTPPAGPEPPPVEDPEHYSGTETGAATKKHKPYTKRLWLVFWLLVALALVVQVSVLLLGLGGRGGNSDFEVAESTAVSYQEETALATETASVQQDAGKIIYSSALDTPGKGTLFVNLSCGNVAFKTGDQAEIEVSGYDHASTVSYGKTVDYGYTLSCDSADPDTHVTITLPADAYDKVAVSVSTQGAIELGNLKIREISAYTANGSIQSGVLRTEHLRAATDLGNIWLEKVSDGVKYQVEQVELLAPTGYVAASFAAAEDQWQKEISAPEGLEQTMGENTESTKYFRTLRVVAADAVTLEYGIT